MAYELYLDIIEPGHDKTWHRVFRPGPTQIGLYSYRRWLSRGLKFRIYEVEALYYLCSENKGTDQLRSAVTAQLICVFVFAKTGSRIGICITNCPVILSPSDLGLIRPKAKTCIIRFIYA